MVTDREFYHGAGGTQAYPLTNNVPTLNKGTCSVLPHLVSTDLEACPHPSTEREPSAFTSFDFELPTRFRPPVPPDTRPMLPTRTKNIFLTSSLHELRFPSVIDNPAL